VRDDDKAFLNYLLVHDAALPGGGRFRGCTGHPGVRDEHRHRQDGWYDERSFNFAEWNVRRRGVRNTSRTARTATRPDFKEALRLYRRILSEVQKGETRHYDNARARAEQITRAGSLPWPCRSSTSRRHPRVPRGVEERPRVDFSVYPIGSRKTWTVGRFEDRGEWLACCSSLDGKPCSVVEGDWRPGGLPARAASTSGSRRRSSPPGAYVIEAAARAARAGHHTS
jgi:hypothetical protein